jgi:hypothetical protein
MPELARDEESALFFPTGDAAACAWKIERLLNDQNLAVCLGNNARKTGLKRNEPSLILSQQCRIYDSLFSMKIGDHVDKRALRQ